ncbi:class I SAM-dependent methyltransferase [Reichenbachiella ulvae]|uniref:Class I SAM-dependent methyltransferase n=1 Tax=Reichenbachiella ulvae TaxID=2980104 RepID=A0ABT3CTJ7_9BACT|nr:class I SAM-dependent methyltransferase [Reichenbachiella ulvae]MCV9387026.1 class I SAM-dependent methyltransferase [Reichenbachiella ulvae]
MKGKIKANTVDRYLSPIRNQIVELIKPNSTVVEYGCGNGDLLFKLSGKIQQGIGIDLSEPLISYAIQRMNSESIDNLDFKIADVLKAPQTDIKTDYSISSLLLHILPWKESKKLLKHQISHADTAIVCGFSKPKNWKQKILLWLDQRFTPHYANFRYYQTKGYTAGLLNSLEGIQYRQIDTFDPVIKIYLVIAS